METNDFQCYLSSGYTFRHLIAYNIYKGNRTKPKPLHYDLVRQHILESWGGTLVEDIEADDKISIDARSLRKREKNYVVCTIDKDLDQIPGKHYNFVKEKFYNIHTNRAEEWLWIQVLAGDLVDNIPGLPRVGVKTAVKYLQDCKSLDEIIMYVKKKYEQVLGDNWRDKFMETGRLVYLLREEEDSFDKYIKKITNSR